MKRLLPLVLLLCAASCRTAELPLRPSSHGEGATPQRTEETPPVNDSKQLAKETPKKGLISKIFGPGKTETKKTTGLTAMPRKCKNCTFVAPGATVSTVGKKATAAVGDNATATTIEKPKAPVASGDNAIAQDFTKQGQRGGAAASGQGATATATTKKGLPWWPFAVGGAVLVAGFIFRKSIPFLG